MVMRLGLCWRRKHQGLKYLCFIVIIFAGYQLLFSRNNRVILTSDEDVEKTKIADRLIEIKRDLAANDTRSFYDGSFLRGTKIKELEDLVSAAMSHIVPGLGDGGGPAKSDISEQSLKDIIKKEAFNLLLSDKIPYTRKLPDVRDPLCIKAAHDHSHLPTASVVIVFTNEAWSSLMRTVFSVLNRSPPHLLKEIILVDDLSTRECLGAQLDYFIKTHLPEKVHLVRLSKRSGLIQARIAGASRATGDVIVFLDAHCEATPMWLEPLLERIKQVPDAAVIPLIDVIDDKTFEYKYGRSLNGIQVGGFTWSGHFTWFSPTRKNLDDLAAPVKSPTMAGGLFAIGRQYFWDVGSYDSRMEVWGGENLEMSFRIWQCGGRLESIPCSRVGHIFRDFHPYSFPGGADTHGINTARLAEVWMDEYKELLYLHRPDLKVAKIGDVSERRELRNKLKCKSFKWFLDNVYPEKFILTDNIQTSGRVFIKRGNRKYCFDTMQREKDTDSYQLGLYQCHALISMSQYFSLTNNGELRRENVCAEVKDVAGAIGRVMMVRCYGMRGAQEWKRTPSGQLQHVATGLCIDATDEDVVDNLGASACDEQAQTQVWEWDASTKWS